MVSNAELVRVEPKGWRSSLANLWRKENQHLWNKRRWLVQAIIWAVIVNGFLAFALFVVPTMAQLTGAGSTEVLDDINNGLQALFQIGSIAMAIGAIVMAQDTIIGERQTGITEWILAKPVSRLAYILAKVLAYSFKVMILFIGLQGIIAYLLFSLAQGSAFPLGPFLVGLIGLTVHTLFYLNLTLMMGVLVNNRGQLLGVTLGILLGGFLVAGLLGKYIMFTPWSISAMVPGYIQGVPLPMSIWVSIGSIFLLNLCAIAFALFRFQHSEF